MAAWLITIGEDYPQHLQYALEKGYWDFADSRRKVPILAEDYLVFRYAAGSVAGIFRARGGTFSLRDSDGHALYSDRDPMWDTPKEFEYYYRVHMDPVSVTPIREVTTAEIRAVLGADPRASYMFQSPTRFVGDAEALLVEAFYAPAVDLAPGWDGPLVGDNLEHDGGGDATRSKRLAWVASREGQDEFRGRLLRSYGGRCALTGTAVEDSLEAAHIIEWRSGGVNDTWNGILLRADVHRLFDRSLIRIRSRNRVDVDQSLVGTEYASLSKLIVPADVNDRPAPHALRWRWEKKNKRSIEAF